MALDQAMNTDSAASVSRDAAENLRPANRRLPHWNWYESATDDEIAEAILASLNFKKMTYENAKRVTVGHVRRIRIALSGGQS